MKHLTTILLIGFGVVLAVIALRAPAQSYVPLDPDLPPEQVPLKLSGNVDDGCVVHVFDVEGICCEGCSAKLYEALAKVDGVREIAVDTVLKTASVVVLQELEPARLEAVLTTDKYVARLRPSGE